MQPRPVSSSPLPSFNPCPLESRYCECSIRKRGHIWNPEQSNAGPFPPVGFSSPGTRRSTIGRDPNENFSDAAVWPCPLRASVSFPNGGTDAPTVAATPAETRCNKHFRFDSPVHHRFCPLSSFPATRGNRPECGCTRRKIMISNFIVCIINFILKDRIQYSEWLRDIYTKIYLEIYNIISLCFL